MAVNLWAARMERPLEPGEVQRLLPLLPPRPLLPLLRPPPPRRRRRRRRKRRKRRRRTVTSVLTSSAKVFIFSQL